MLAAVGIVVDREEHLQPTGEGGTFQGLLDPTRSEEANAACVLTFSFASHKPDDVVTSETTGPGGVACVLQCIGEGKVRVCIMV
jgi:hypothetical protein